MITRIVHVPGSAPMASADMVRVEYSNGHVDTYPASYSHAACLARNTIITQVSAREWVFRHRAAIGKDGDK